MQLIVLFVSGKSVFQKGRAIDTGEVEIGAQVMQTIPPGLFWRFQITIHHPMYLKFNISLAKDSLLGIYGRRNIPPTHTQVIRNNTNSIMLTFSNSSGCERSQTLSNQGGRKGLAVTTKSSMLALSFTEVSLHPETALSQRKGQCRTRKVSSCNHRDVTVRAAGLVRALLLCSSRIFFAGAVGWSTRSFENTLIFLWLHQDKQIT